MLSIVLKYVLPVVAVIGLLFGVYSYGHSNGSDEGYKTAWDAQQKTIQGMVDKQNAQTTVQNQAISNLEQKSMKDASDLFAAKAQGQVQTTQVITKYVQANPTVAKTCGWDPATSQAINDLIDAEPVNNGFQTSTDPVNTGSNPTTGTATPQTEPANQGATQ